MSNGTQERRNSTLFDGPWASAVNDKGNTAQLFVSNVEGGTVTRVNLKVVKHHGQASLKVVSMTQIASGYLVQPNPAAVIVGPGGLAYNPKNDTLYVAATGNNEIFAIPHASKAHSSIGTGTLVYQDPAHLRGPIGLALAPNGDLLATNDDAVNVDSNQPSELIEFSTAGHFIGELSLDPNQGAAFQLVVQSTRHTVTIFTLNDDVSALDSRTITI
jgi:DNA-binding beta-propeller fold protein YncE